MGWKDEYREDKQDSGLTWDEYHERRFVHVDDLDDMQAAIADLTRHVEAVTNEYQDLKREFHEVRRMLESEEFDP